MMRGDAVAVCEPWDVRNAIAHACGEQYHTSQNALPASQPDVETVEMATHVDDRRVLLLDAVTPQLRPTTLQ